MIKSVWLYVLTLAVVSAGGWYYFEKREVRVTEVTTIPAIAPQPTQSPSGSNEEQNRKREEGIGSIRKLKPVPIPTGNAR